MRFYCPQFLIPTTVISLVLFSLAMAVTQKTESKAAVVLAPKLIAEETSPVLTAPIFRVFDINTGEVIVTKGADTQVPIASVVKLFAAATLVREFDLQSTTSITWLDIEGGGGAGKLAFGQTYSYQNLLFPLLIESSNDAAQVLVRATEGRLVARMNTWVSTTQATQTVFTDASGLSDANVSSASDLQLLLTAAFKNKPHVFDISTLPQYIGSYTGWLNNNPVATTDGFRGGKNGYTTAAGRTLVAIFDEEINGHTYTLGYIILGSSDIATDTKTLRDFIKM